MFYYFLIFFYFNKFYIYQPETLKMSFHALFDGRFMLLLTSNFKCLTKRCWQHMCSLFLLCILSGAMLWYILRAKYKCRKLTIIWNNVVVELVSTSREETKSIMNSANKEIKVALKRKISWNLMQIFVKGMKKLNYVIWAV